MNRPPLHQRVFLWLALTVLFTAVMVQYSLNHGPLLRLTRFDDIGYITDGLWRLQTAWKTTVSAASLQSPVMVLARQYAAHPPISPFSTSLAFVSFAIFGLHGWSPYAGNGITLMALLAVMDGLLGGLKLWQRVACLLIVLSTPIAGLFIVEFRPDFMAALLTVLFILIVLKTPLGGMSRRHRLLTGGILGLAILIKPTVFPVTLFLAAAAIGASWWRDWLMRQSRPRVGELAEVAAPAILIPLPHFLVAGGQTVQYIWENVFGADRQVWIAHSGMTHATLATRLLWYLTGPGGVATLGAFLLIAPPIMLIAAFLVKRKYGRRGSLTLGCYAAMAAVAYLIPAINWQKQVFLGGVFYLLILAGLMISLRLLFLHGKRWAAAIVLATLLAGCVGFVWPQDRGDRADPVILARNRVIEQVYAAIREHAPPPRPAHVFLTFLGNVNTDVLEFLALREGITDYDIEAQPKSADPAMYRGWYEMNDMVIATDPGNPEIEVGFPSSSFLAESLAMIRARRDYHLIGTVTTYEGFHYYLFAKR